MNKKYCNHLFSENTDGYIQIAELKGSTIGIQNTTNKNLREVIQEYKGQTDVYLTSNTTYLPERRVGNIRQFRALYIDLDIVELGYSKSETVYMVWDLVNQDMIPKPTMVIDSGRGIHLYWRIENAPYGALTTWQELEDYLYYKLKHLGADRKATDGVRLLRVPETINSKNNSECKVLLLDEELIYSMYDLREKYLKYKFKKKQLQFEQTKNEKTKKVVSNKFFNSYSLHQARITDIKKLCELRHYNVTGYRNMLLHCYAYWSGIYTRDIEQLETDVIEFNNSFSYPLKQSEVRAVLKSVPKAIDKFIAYEQGVRSGEVKRVTKGMRDKAGYWYKNETLIERLEISAREQGYMKTIIGKEEKYSRRRDKDKEYQREKRKAKYRNTEGLTKTEVKRRDEFILIARMELQGMSQRAIAKELGYSDNKGISRKMNKEYKQINYKEILEEVKQGGYDDLQIAI